MAIAGSHWALLLGRQTYQDFYAYWPKQADNPFTQVLDTTHKYVAPTTLSEPLPWANSRLLEGRRRRGRGRAQAPAGQGPGGARQRRAGPVTARANLNQPR
jgi:hypothetical protein